MKNINGRQLKIRNKEKENRNLEEIFFFLN